jgi:hypothetical protein
MLDQERRALKRRPANRNGTSSIEQVLSAARTRLRRLSPDEAYDAAARAEAILVDIRPEGQRAIEGGIAGTLAATRVMEIGLYLPSFVGCQRSSRKSSCAPVGTRCAAPSVAWTSSLCQRESGVSWEDHPAANGAFILLHIPESRHFANAVFIRLLMQLGGPRRSNFIHCQN